MKKLFFILMILLILSACKTVEPLYPEDEIFVTRKYVGMFVSNSIPEKVKFGDVAIMEIFTTISDFDTIRIYAKKIDLIPGERLYIRRSSVYSSPWKSEYYNLETDKQSFRICEFGYGNKLLTQSWY